MTNSAINDENKSDIIDIDPETVIENETIITPPSASKNQRKYAGSVLVALAMLAAAGLGGWFYRNMLSTYLPSDQISSMNLRMDALEAANKTAGQKLDALVGFIDETKSQLAAAQTAAEDARKLATDTKLENGLSSSKLVSVEKSLTEVAKQIDSIKSKVAVASLGGAPADNSALISRLDTLEKSLANTQQNTKAEKANATQLSQAVTNLKDKIASGNSFKDEIQLLSQLIPAAEGLDVLSSNADKGTATQLQLVKAVKDIGSGLAPKIEATSEPQDNSWWGTTASIFSGLVTVKTVDAIDWQELALQCGSLVEQGHIDDALKLLNQNLDSLPKPLQDWRILAAKRLSVDTAFEQVNRAVSREILARG